MISHVAHETPIRHDFSRAVKLERNSSLRLWLGAPNKPGFGLVGVMIRAQLPEAHIAALFWPPGRRSGVPDKPGFGLVGRRSVKRALKKIKCGSQN